MLFLDIFWIYMTTNSVSSSIWISAFFLSSLFLNHFPLSSWKTNTHNSIVKTSKGNKGFDAYIVHVSFWREGKKQVLNVHKFNLDSSACCSVNLFPTFSHLPPLLEKIRRKCIVPLRSQVSKIIHFMASGSVFEDLSIFYRNCFEFLRTFDWTSI